MWPFNVQVLPETEAENYHWNLFDLIKIWQHENFPSQYINYLYLQYYATLKVNISLVQKNRNMMDILSFQNEDVRYFDLTSSNY
jgi:hypothetical protein